jgi:hypothetical protein
MILNMWGTGELRRTYRTVKDAKGNAIECMVIRRPLERDALPAVIPLRDMHIFYPQTQEEWTDIAVAPYQGDPLCSFMAVAHCAARLLLPLTGCETDFSRRGTLRRLCDYIQDGFDELMKVKPHEEEKKAAVGEYEVLIDGEKVGSGDLSERV